MTVRRKVRRQKYVTKAPEYAYARKVIMEISVVTGNRFRKVVFNHYYLLFCAYLTAHIRNTCVPSSLGVSRNTLATQTVKIVAARIWDHLQRSVTNFPER